MKSESIKQGLIATAVGDGVGSEIIPAATKVLKAVAKKYSLNIRHVKIPLGEEAEDLNGNPIPENSITVASGCSAVLTGPLETDVLLGLGRHLGAAFCSFPVISFPQIENKVPLKSKLLTPAVNILFVMPCDEYDLYGKESATGSIIFESMACFKDYSKRAALYAINAAAKRKKRITVVDINKRTYFKRNIEEALYLNRFSGFDIRYMSAENLMEELLTMPSIHDVIFAPIWDGMLLYQAAITGTSSRQLLPIKIDGKPSLYAPATTSMKWLSGMGKANPIGMIFALALLLEHTFLQTSASLAIKNSTISVIEKGFRTEDIWSEGNTLVSTDEMTDIIINEIIKKR